MLKDNGKNLFFATKKDAQREAKLTTLMESLSVLNSKNQRNYLRSLRNQRKLKRARKLRNLRKERKYLKVHTNFHAKRSLTRMES